MAEQVKSILSQITGLLAKAGTNKTKPLSADIWITDMAWRRVSFFGLCDRLGKRSWPSG